MSRRAAATVANGQSLSVPDPRWKPSDRNVRKSAGVWALSTLKSPPSVSFNVHVPIDNVVSPASFATIVLSDAEPAFSRACATFVPDDELCVLLPFVESAPDINSMSDQFSFGVFRNQPLLPFQSSMLCPEAICRSTHSEFSLSTCQACTAWIASAAARV